MVWRACERFMIQPPEVQSRWEDNEVPIMSALIAYNHIREMEEAEYAAALSGASLKRAIGL